MARSVREREIGRSRRVGRTLALPQLGALRWRTPLLLALLTLVALVVAYSSRPVVRIDLGGEYDSAFVRDFNGREIDAAGVAQSYAWPAGQATLEIPGRLEGVWIATLEAAADQPDEILRQAAVAVNDYRVDMPRRTPRQIIASIPPEVGAAERLTFDLVPPLVGGLEPPSGLVGRLTLAPARTYRWSRDESTLALPGLGRGAWGVELTVVTAHPDGQAVDAQLLANGVLLAKLPDSNTTRRISLLVPATLMASGDLDLTIRASTYRDPRPLGVFIADALVAPVGGGAFTTALPPWGVLGAALIVVLGLYACLTLLTGGGVAPPPWRLLSAGAALAAIAAGAWALIFHRFPTSFMLPALAWMMLWSLVLLLLLRPLVERLGWTVDPSTTLRAGGGRWTVDDGTLGYAQDMRWSLRLGAGQVDDDAVKPSTVHRPPSFTNLLLLAFFFSFWFKAGGMLYPYFVGIDVQWHMDRARWIIDGQLPLLYGTNSPLNESTMPTAEWGENRPVIPYSPWFHIFATSFALLPLPMTFTANMFSVLIDSSRVVLIALLALAFGMSRRAALMAAALYAVMPVAFLLHAWGNIPTATGLWLSLVAIVAIAATWPRLGQRGPMIGLALLLTATFLIYTVSGVFMGVYLVLLTMIVWLAARQGPDWRRLAVGLRPLWLATGAAILAAVLIYYGQYILPILERTVPYFQTVFTQGAQSVGVERPPFGEYMWQHLQALDYRIWPGRYLFYGLGLPLIFTVPGLLALWRRPLAATTLAAWLTVGLLFMFAGYRISMVDKQLFFILPAISICWAVYAERYWLRGSWGRWFVIAIYLYSAATALDQWFFRIAVSPVA